MSGLYADPGRENQQSGCPLTPGSDLSTQSCSFTCHDQRIGLTMSAATSSLKHASVYGFTQREASSSSSSSSYSPLRRLQHLTTMVSQPDLVLPVREPGRSWEWGLNKRERGKEMDSLPDCSSSDYSGTQDKSEEESFGKQNQPVVPTRSRGIPSANRIDLVSEKKIDGCFSDPPSPAFSLDSSSPFANGFLHFESSLFEDEDDEERKTASPLGGSQDKRKRAENVLQSTPRDLNMDSKVTLSSAKVVTRSQSSGQRRRYWDGSDDEWDSETELFLLGDSSSRHSMQNSHKKKSLPPLKFLEGEVIWAKFSRRPWWPCEVIVDPVQGIYHRVKEPSDRPCRLYHVRTFGEPVELTWVEDKATQTFHGGFEFQHLPQLRRGKQRVQNFKYTISKRFQNSWKSSVTEAESVLPERPKMGSSIPSSSDDTFHDSSTPVIVNKSHPTLPSSSSPSPPETSHITNESILCPDISCPIKTPAKLSTLRKSSGKKKTSKSSKDINNKHSKRVFRNSPDQSDRNNGECPYSDLDSVPKILCPKALERQSKLVPTRPSVKAVKEVKKQPEIQSGLWFSKSGKERRRKTTSPMPDRTLFSKVAAKKKNLSVVSKKTLVSGAFPSSGGSSDQSQMPDKHKSLAPVETILQPEQSGHLKCKIALVADGTAGSPTDQSTLPDKQKSIVSLETAVPSDKCGASRGRQTVSNTTGTVTDTASEHLDNLEVKNTNEPTMTFSINDEFRISDGAKGVSQTELSDVLVHKKVCENYTVSKKKAKKKESNKPTSGLNVDTTESLGRLEKQKSLFSKCRLPIVKLVCKDMKDKRLSTSGIISPTDQPKCRKNEKTPDTNMTKMSSKKSDCLDSNARISKDQTGSSESIKVSVKKLKASVGTGILRLTSESSQVKIIVASEVADELSSTEEGRIPTFKVRPRNVTQSSSKQPNQSEGKETSASNAVSMSEQKLTSVSSTVPPPSHQQENIPRRNTHGPGSMLSEKSKKVVHNSKQVNRLRLPEPPSHLPASSRLMTRALKAMTEAEQKKREKARKEPEQKTLIAAVRKDEDPVPLSSPDSTRNPKPQRDCHTKIKSKSNCDGNGEYDQGTCCSTSHLMFSDSDEFEVVKSEDEDLSLTSTPPMDFIPLTSKVKAKKEDHSSFDKCSSSSPSSQFSFMNVIKNVEEVSFQSLTKEGKGKPISFKANTNYKFSTFLMMLKDLHDTREREGTPLELEIGPPSAHVKEEPFVMSGEATPSGQNQQIEHINISSPDKIKTTHKEDGTSQTSKRPINRRGSSTALKKKSNQKVLCRPVRSGPGFPQWEYLPRMNSSLGGESRVQSPLGIKTSSWARQTGDGEGVVGEEEEGTWSRVNENLQNTAPSELRGCNTTLCLEQANGLAADCSETNASLIPNSGEGNKTPAGHKRIRKPSKRLIEWTEDYDQIFSTRKKSKKPLQLIGKASQPITPASEPLGLDQDAHDHPSLNLLPDIQTPPPEEIATITATPSELQIPSTENTSSQDAPVLSIDTLTPPPEADPSPSKGLVTG